MSVEDDVLLVELRAAAEEYRRGHDQWGADAAAMQACGEKYGALHELAANSIESLRAAFATAETAVDRLHRLWEISKADRRIAWRQVEAAETALRKMKDTDGANWSP